MEPLSLNTCTLNAQPRAHTSTAREVAAARVEVLFSKTKSISPSEIYRRSIVFKANEL
jgi:hypothetical protein